MDRLTLPLEVGKKYVRRDGMPVYLYFGSEYNPKTGHWGESSDHHSYDIVADYIEPVKGHPHAALMALYAQDAAETDKPWERWEAKTGDGSWVGVGRHPVWEPEQEYRRKPKTIRIGEYDVPEPMRVAPVMDGSVYYAPILKQAGSEVYVWVGDDTDRWNLAAGLVHTTREAADTHARALIALSAAP